MDDYDDHIYCFTCDRHEVTCWCTNFVSPDREDGEERGSWCWSPEVCGNAGRPGREDQEGQQGTGN